MRGRLVECPCCGHTNTGSPPRCVSCGADLTLVVAVLHAARTLAAKAVRLAARGAWQEAYDASAESLRLQWRGNDLAAFILLLCAVNGAAGSVTAIPRPMPENLPEQLRVFLPSLLRTAGEVGESPQGRPAAISRPTTTFVWLVRRVLLGAVPLVLGLLMGHLLWPPGAITVTPPARGDAALSSSAPPGTTTPRVRGLPPSRMDGALERGRGDEDARVLRLSRAALAGDWDGMVATLAGMDPERRNGLVRRVLPPSFARRAYLAGISASRYGDYPRAEILLGVALSIAPPGSYFEDDALYYRARALQRSGRPAEAGKVFNGLLEAHPSSPYTHDARRFLRGTAGCGGS